MTDQKTIHPEIDILHDLTARIVAAYVSGNTVSVAMLPDIINTVFQALSGLGHTTVKTLDPVPAVPVKKSVFPDYIICLEDGKKLKMLKRHLQSAYGMTPKQYREKWGLPESYPMTAPSYSTRRSALAQESGLGRAIKASSEETAEADVPITLLPEKKRRHRSNLT